jgi:hypothetical protein
MPEKTPPPDILQLPYSERQLIVVQPDDVVAATRQAEAPTTENDAPPDWKDSALRVGKAAFRFTILSPITDITFDALSAWAKAREGGLNVLQVARSEASRLQFPPGHPREQSLYVAHPALPSVYYTTASFHRMVFEHKFAEAIYLLMSLGAAQIIVEHVRGWSREFSARISTPLPEVDAKIEASNLATSATSLLFEATLNNKQVPAIPDELVWYAHEPTWQAVAKGRIQFGLSQFSLTVNYDDDFSVNSGLKLRVQKAGLDLGGTFEDHLATTWKIHGKFGSDV